MNAAHYNYRCATPGPECQCNNPTNTALRWSTRADMCAIFSVCEFISGAQSQFAKTQNRTQHNSHTHKHTPNMYTT